MEDIKAVSKKTLQDLESLKRAGILKGFYLGGGTGLAFLLGHRESHDLDFFCRAKFNERLLSEKLRKAGKFSLEKKEDGTLRGKFSNTLVSFFHYPYPFLEKPMRKSGTAVASFRDIACMKIDAIASRGTKRDFIDVYMIMKMTGLTLPALFKDFSKKYVSLHYNLMHIKKSLVYFADAEGDPMPKMVKLLSWPEVKKFFIAEARRL